MKPARRSRAQTKRLLTDLLADTPRDEKAGAHASRGFSFQNWWATLRVVDLLAENAADFAVAMEVKEDVAILDSAENPTTVEFCQVKKNERGSLWTLKNLHARGQKRADGTRDRSILSKLYSRRQDFAGHPISLSFVSNALVDAAADAGHSTPSKCALDSLPVEKQDAIREKIADELSLKPEQIDLSEFALHSTDLSLTRPNLLVAGRIAEECERGRLPISIRQPNVVAGMLASEIQKRSNSTAFAQTMDELKERILTKSQALEVIAAAASSNKPAQEAIEEGCARLNIESYDFRAVQAIRKRAASVAVQATDRTNVSFWNVAGEMAAKLPEADARCTGRQLGELMEQLVALATTNTTPGAMDHGFLCGIALLVIYEGISFNAQPSAAGAKPKDEE